MRTMTMTAALAAAITAAPAMAAFSVTIEQPKVQNSTATFSFSGVETFSSRSVGNGQNFTSNFGTAGSISGAYAGVDIRSASDVGGAGGTGVYASTSSGTGFSLTLSTTNASGINYFGFWLSGLDRGNQLTFYKGATAVYTFSPTDVLTLVNGNSAYFGNPNPQFAGQDSSEAFAFLNFFDNGDTFDRIVFFEQPQVGGYESDNHTVGFFTQQSGTPVGPAVPEPPSWAMFIGGFGLVGAAMRRRRRVAFA